MTEFESLLKSAAVWSQQAAKALEQDPTLLHLSNVAVSQNWPLVVCVDLQRMVAHLCLINPVGQMQSLVTAGIEAATHARH
jgi:hypothetical protein